MGQSCATKPGRFVMLGVIHGDEEGRGLIGDWLESTGPDAVTVEFSRYGLDYRRRNGDALKEKVRAAVAEIEADGHAVDEYALDSLYSYIGLPFEFTSASDYCARHGAPLFPVDLDRFSFAHLRRMDELVSKDNLAVLLSTRASGGREKAMARLFFEKGVRAFSYTAEMRLRDRHMSATISRLLKESAPACLVHICGWQHLCDPFDQYGPLYPRKVFIHDKALCV